MGGESAHSPVQIGYHGKPIHLPPGVRIPDWKQYKVEDAPDLVNIQKRLAARGLKDPWIRNEVWRYDWRIWGHPNRRLFKAVFRGFHYGFAAFVFTILYNEVIFKDENDHHHEDKYLLSKEIEKMKITGNVHGH